MKQHLIIGAGISGVSASKLLLKLGQKVKIADTKPVPLEIKEQLKEAEIIEGPQTPELLTDIDKIILSPGVPPNIPILLEAKKRNIPIETEIDLALSLYTGSIVGITGTNGKSTTCIMTKHLLSSLNIDTREGGNVGTPLSEIVTKHKDTKVLVLELSSYQLELSRNINLDVAMFISFSRDHLQRHGTMENYFKAKWRMIEAVIEDGLVILTNSVFDKAIEYKVNFPENRNYIVISDKREPTHSVNSHPNKTSNIFIDDNKLLDKSNNTICNLAPANLSSHHNKLNGAFAILAARFFLPEEKLEEMIPLLKNYPALPHRYEKVGEWQDYPIINDSKATNVDATLVALKSQKVPCFLLLGGEGKGESYLPITEYKSKIKIAICFGTTGPDIKRELENEIETVLFPTLNECLSNFNDIVNKYEAAPIIFSPACASFDEFKNFEHRGSFFTQNILKYIKD